MNIDHLLAVSLEDEFELGDYSGSSESEDDDLVIIVDTDDDNDDDNDEKSLSLHAVHNEYSYNDNNDHINNEHDDFEQYNIYEWSCRDLCKWLKSLSFLFDTYVIVFKNKNINGKKLLEMTAQQLTDECNMELTYSKYILALARRMAKDFQPSSSLHNKDEQINKVTPPPPPPPPKETSSSSLPSIITRKSQSKSKDYSILLDGHYFQKYGRRGKPKRKFVCISRDYHHLIWSNSPEEGYMRSVGLQLKSYHRTIDLRSVQRIIIGKDTPVFKRHIAHNAEEKCCFSLVSNERSLDLEAQSIDIVQEWVRLLNTLTNID